VNVTAAEVRKVIRTVDVVGSLAPEETVTVSSEVPGRVVAVHTDFGRTVRKGEVLVELDRTEIALQLERAKAALAQALARVGLDADRAGARPDSTPAIRQAEAQMLDAKSKYENAKRLIETGDIARERFEELEKNYQARQAALDSMRDDLRVQLANIQALRADVGLQEKRLRDTKILAPFDGQVSARTVAPGQYVKDNTPLLTIVKVNPLRLHVDVPEVAVQAMNVGTEVTFTTDAIPGKEFKAVVRQLNPSLDDRARALVAEARLTTSDPRLKPGMFVQVRVIAARNFETVMVPERALLTVAGLTKVFVARDGKAVEYKISPGIRQDGWVEALGAPIAAGDLIVTSGLPSLVSGAELAVAAAAATKG
jgi:RND family efflux transporter MFP subunit